MRAVIIEYENEYERGYADAIADMRRRRQREQERKARRWYFLKQKALGAAVLAVTVLAVWLLEGDATIAIFFVPLGLALLFSRQMLVVNDYYFEMEEGRNDKWKL